MPINQIILLITLIMSFAFGIYGLLLYKKVKGSNLANIIFYTSISIIFFGAHSIFEISDLSILNFYLSETFEIGGSVFMLLAAYNICKISEEIFVPEEYPIKKIIKKIERKNK